MTHDWGYSSEATASAGAIPLPRGKLIGGCSSTNGAFALRGAPADYDEWAALGNEGWSFADVLPTFCALEKDEDFDGAYHGKSGPVPSTLAVDALVDEQHAFLDACSRECPEAKDHDAPDAIGVGPVPMNAANGVRLSTALTHLGPARSRPNLKVRCGRDRAGPRCVSAVLSRTPFAAFIGTGPTPIASGALWSFASGHSLEQACEMPSSTRASTA